MAWICASGMGTLLRKPSRAPLIVLSGELHENQTLRQRVSHISGL